MSELQNPLDTPDFGLLRSGDDYASYFRLLQTGLSRLAHAYEQAVLETADRLARLERERVSTFAARFLRTLAALWMRSIYERGKNHPLFVDLSDSGFPHFHEILRLEADVVSAEEELGRMPALPALKRVLENRVIIGDPNPVAELAAVARRTYLEMLSGPEQLFLTFSSGGEIRYMGPGRGNRREYLYLWSAYDSSANVPLLYTLVFEQSGEEEPLQEGGRAWEVFFRKIKTEGSHKAPLKVIAASLDALESIYPKVLKRLTFGPLYSPILFEAREDTLSERESAIRALLTASGGEDPFLVLASEEIIVSEREEKARTTMLGSLFSRKDVRQVFGNGNEGAENLETVLRYALLPHQMLQHVSPEVAALVPELDPRTVFIPFNEKGELINVSGFAAKRYSN